ncbi:hypothetical protein GCM10027592_03610 [Spirosoma flavus]
MSFINLHHTEILAASAYANYENAAAAQLYNRLKTAKTVTAKQLINLIKTQLQANNLHSKLTKLHQVCTDYTAGNFDACIDEHNQWQERTSRHGRFPFEPINHLHYCLLGHSDDVLPVQIERYQELLNFAQGFAEFRSRQREGSHPFYGPTPYHYEILDESGALVVVPEDELPESIKADIVAASQTEDIKVSDCLNHYNLFYQRVRLLVIESTNEDVQSYAQAILLLFDPNK